MRHKRAPRRKNQINGCCLVEMDRVLRAFDRRGCSNFKQALSKVYELRGEVAIVCEQCAPI
jgi:hypothetical protein